MHVKYRNSAGTDKKCHCNQTIIIAEDIVGKFYCSSQNISDVWQCQFFHMGGLMHSNAHGTSSEPQVWVTVLLLYALYC